MKGIFLTVAAILATLSLASCGTPSNSSSSSWPRGSMSGSSYYRGYQPSSSSSFGSAYGRSSNSSSSSSTSSGLLSSLADLVCKLKPGG